MLGRALLCTAAMEARAGMGLTVGTVMAAEGTAVASPVAAVAEADMAEGSTPGGLCMVVATVVEDPRRSLQTVGLVGRGVAAGALTFLQDAAAGGAATATGMATMACSLALSILTEATAAPTEATAVPTEVSAVWRVAKAALMVATQGALAGSGHKVVTGDQVCTSFALVHPGAWPALRNTVLHGNDVLRSCVVRFDHGLCVRTCTGKPSLLCLPCL